MALVGTRSRAPLVQRVSRLSVSRFLFCYFDTPPCGRAPRCVAETLFLFLTFAGRITPDAIALASIFLVYARPSAFMSLGMLQLLLQLSRGKQHGKILRGRGCLDAAYQAAHLLRRASQPQAYCMPGSVSFGEGTVQTSDVLTRVTLIGPKSSTRLPTLWDLMPFVSV
jgi:hypothetical protein